MLFINKYFIIIIYMKKTNNSFKRAFSKFKKRRLYVYNVNSVKQTTNSSINIKVEYYDTIIFANGSSVPNVQDIGQPYLNFARVLGQNNGFVAESASWQRYKITGASLEFVPCMDLGFARTIFALAGPGIAAAVNVDRTSSNRGAEPRDSDNVLVSYVAIQLPQRKYWKFKDNFLSAAGVGVGTWNRCVGYPNQEGQFSICNLEDGNVNTGESSHNTFNLKATIYVTMSTKLR